MYIFRLVRTGQYIFTLWQLFISPHFHSNQNWSTNQGNGSHSTFNNRSVTSFVSLVVLPLLLFVGVLHLVWCLVFVNSRNGITIFTFIMFLLPFVHSLSSTISICLITERESCCYWMVVLWVVCSVWLLGITFYEICWYVDMLLYKGITLFGVFRRACNLIVVFLFLNHQRYKRWSFCYFWKRLDRFVSCALC